MSTEAGDKEILEKNGWTVECESPFEIRHEDGSFATHHAAHMVVFYLHTQVIISNTRKNEDEH